MASRVENLVLEIFNYFRGERNLVSIYDSNESLPPNKLKNAKGKVSPAASLLVDRLVAPNNSGNQADTIDIYDEVKRLDLSGGPVQNTFISMRDLGVIFGDCDANIPKDQGKHPLKPSNREQVIDELRLTPQQWVASISDKFVPTKDIDTFCEILLQQKCSDNSLDLIDAALSKLTAKAYGSPSLPNAISFCAKLEKLQLELHTYCQSNKWNPRELTIQQKVAVRVHAIEAAERILDVSKQMKITLLHYAEQLYTQAYYESGVALFKVGHRDSYSISVLDPNYIIMGDDPVDIDPDDDRLPNKS
jgi:hypothetical protein